MRISFAGTILAVGLLALTGCQSERTSYGTRLPSQPAPLAPAPVGNVQGSQLPPPDASQFPAAPGQAGQTDQQQMANLEANAPAIQKESLIGRWTVASSGSTCDLFLALTKWTGGYRAASRNCAGPAADISAWDVKGNQVVLSDSTGNQIASLYQSANERYEGSTTSGQTISLSR